MLMNSLNETVSYYESTIYNFIFYNDWPPLLAGELRRRLPTDPNKRGVFPRELRRHRPLHALRQPPMAARLPHRLHRHHVRVALPLFPPRSAERVVGVWGGGARGAGGSVDLDGGAAAPDADHSFSWGLAAGLAASMGHAVFRGTNDLDFDEDGGGEVAVGLRETASATYSVL